MTGGFAIPSNAVEGHSSAFNGFFPLLHFSTTNPVSFARKVLNYDAARRLVNATRLMTARARRRREA